MKNNPFAKVFRQAFEKDILSTAIYIPDVSDRPTIEPRVSKFLNTLNNFLHTSGVAPILYQKYIIDEKKLLEYALFLRGYMRDAQSILSQLNPQHATDDNMISLFNASSEYVVSCNRQFGNKKTFDNNVDYRLWKLHANNTEGETKYTTVVDKINPSKHNMFLFMPFRIKENEHELKKWVFTNMQNTLNNRQIFGKDVDVYVNFFPIQKSRSSNVYSLLKTLKEAETYYEDTDLQFVKKYWLDFIGKNITLDKNGFVTSGELYDEEKLQNEFSNISIFAYCSGAANAHRCLNALYSITSQMYDISTTKKAMQHIGVMTYGFLPIQQYSLYSGIHFYTNAANDTNRHEPFVNLNNHLLYEKTKCNDATNPAKYSVMPDGRNFVISLKLPENMSIWKDDQATSFQDKEYGHSILFITKPNILDSENYSYKLFRNTLENFSLGKRGIEALSISHPESITPNIVHHYLKGQMQRL